MSKLAGSKLGYEAGLAHKIKTTVLYTTQVPKAYHIVLDYTGQDWNVFEWTGLDWTERVYLRRMIQTRIK